MFFKKNFYFILLLFIVVFKNWFYPHVISSGDFSFISTSRLQDISLMPYAWGWNLAVGGLGAFVSPFSWLHFIEAIPLLFARFFSLNWLLAERVFYFYPLLLALIVIPILFFKKFFPSSKFAFISTLIFSLNTYVLMLIGGGQIFISLAYAIAPLVFYLFLVSFNQKKLLFSFLIGLVLSLQVMLDLRIAYVTVFVFLFYLLFNIDFSKKFLFRIVYSLGIPFFIAFLLNSYWIIPTLILRVNPLYDLGQIYTSFGAVKFFSFATFENTISLLHPNWPENLFGKVSFMRPEFLIVPILAYSSLFFIKNEEERIKKNILFFAILGLLGAFLAKGANDPFGFIYIWLFDHIPGFIMFRDPTKWYLLIAISYSILIPFSIGKIYEYLSKFKRPSLFNFSSKNIFLLAVLVYLLFLIDPAIFGKLSGAFKSTTIPSDYTQLEKYLSLDENFYRVLWFPMAQRFAPFSNLHPALPAREFLKEVDNKLLVEKFKQEETQRILINSSVKYVIIPYDSQGEIFLKDRKYNNDLYLFTLKQLKSVSWLKNVKQIGKIYVFEIENYKDHFWTTSGKSLVKYERISPVSYKLYLENVKINDRLVFSEKYDKNWILKEPGNSKTILPSEPYDKVFNSFILQKEGNYTIDLYYGPQIYVMVGVMLGSITLILILLYLLIGSRVKK
ncbi:MAG: hypothetical protein HY344_04770 [Candidatus Levybacteria bacterium]|nr:hypothetical protein [Candidatus Levybacteria bacterium]